MTERMYYVVEWCDGNKWIQANTEIPIEKDQVARQVAHALSHAFACLNRVNRDGFGVIRIYKVEEKRMLIDQSYVSTLV